MEYITKKDIPQANETLKEKFILFLEFVVEKEYFDIVLRILEEKGWMWMEGQKPTEYHFEFDPSIVILHSGDRISHREYEKNEIMDLLYFKISKTTNYNGLCPACLNKAFLLFNSVECSNPNCRFG